jgi:hypothetical protein
MDAIVTAEDDFPLLAQLAHANPSNRQREALAALGHIERLRFLVGEVCVCKHHRIAHRLPGMCLGYCGADDDGPIVCECTEFRDIATPVLSGDDPTYKEWTP